MRWMLPPHSPAPTTLSALLNQRDPALAADITGLYQSYDSGVNFWIRPTAPTSGLSAFRISPWRKWGWEHRTSDSLSWAQGAIGDADLLYVKGLSSAGHRKFNAEPRHM